MNGGALEMSTNFDLNGFLTSLTRVGWDLLYSDKCFEFRLRLTSVKL